MPDLNLREAVMLAPIVGLIVFIGVYPRPFLDRIEPAARVVVNQLNSGSAEPVAEISEAP